MKESKLGILTIAFMYVGTIMGAGFASGREIWQFFGVFGRRGYIGVLLVGVLFVVIGVMTSLIARKLATNEMGKVIVPGRHRGMVSFVSYFMALMLFTVLITMSAAGGALFQQQFALSRVLGGAVIIALVIITVIGGFDRVSRVFRYIMPILVVTVIGVCILVYVMDLPPSGQTAELVPSPLAPHWILSAVEYVSYNILGVIPIVATASIHAKSGKHAVIGSGLGGVFLAILAFVLLTVLGTDGAFSQNMDMPMLAYSERIAPSINIIYTCVLLFAIYASATSNYYGFTTRLKESPKKKTWIVLVAIVGFLFGLIGFKNVVAYMFPLEGIMGISIIIMVMVNYMKLRKKKGSLFDVFGEDYDRFAFPEGIVRVTAGHGGEAILILGSEKTALLDCGMAYCGDAMVENIARALSGRTLDFVLMSHTHYDHIGALPYVRKAFPGVKSFGSEHGKRILSREGALRLIKELGETARTAYDPDSAQEILIDGLGVDHVLRDGDKLSLGDMEIIVLETKGHTDCSLTFVIEPLSLMFASESTGILEDIDYVHTPILKNYRDSLESLNRCKAYHPKYLLLPHFGLLPQHFNEEYWQLFEKSVEDKRSFLYSLHQQNLSDDEILNRYMDRYWTPEKAEEQPIQAFELNAKLIIKAIRQEF